VGSRVAVEMENGLGCIVEVGGITCGDDLTVGGGTFLVSAVFGETRILLELWLPSSVWVMQPVNTTTRMADITMPTFLKITEGIPKGWSTMNNDH
jgi:hypothetical protein